MYSQLISVGSTGKTQTKQTLRDQYNYNLLKDGLHPGINVANVWLKKLELQIKKDC